MDGWVGGWVSGQEDGRVDGWISRWEDGWVGRRTDELMLVSSSGTHPEPVVPRTCHRFLFQLAKDIGAKLFFLCALKFYCQLLVTGPHREISTSSLLFLKTSSCSQVHAFSHPLLHCHVLFSGEAGATSHVTNRLFFLALGLHSPPGSGPPCEFQSSSGMLTRALHFLNVPSTLGWQL